MIGEKVILKKPMTYAHDSHYPSGMVDGGQIPQYFGELVSELMTRAAGCSGRIRFYKTVDYTYPVWVSDVVEYQGWIEKREGYSFEVHFDAYIIQTFTDEFKQAHRHGSVRPEHNNFRGYEGTILCDPPVHCGGAVAIVEVSPDAYKGPQDPKFAEE